MKLRPTGKFTTLLAGVSATLAMFLLWTPSAQADSDPNLACQFLPGRHFWHFQNYTNSGKQVTLDGYSGPNATGQLVTQCKFHIRNSTPFGSSYSGESYLDPASVKSVKITIRSDHGGDLTETDPNDSNSCFRITYPGARKGFVLSRHYQCVPPPKSPVRHIPEAS
jgi:hypothetical protein